MDAGIKVILIAAMAKNSRVIGREGKVPWNLSDDLKAFKKLTLGKTVIVGRKTQDSIIARLGHPLSNRRTIVLTRDKNYQCQDCDTASSWAEALKLAKNEKEVFVLGGSEVYKLALPYADTMYLTIVEANPQGDAYFPGFNSSEWDRRLEERHQQDEKNEYEFSRWMLTRKNK